MSTMPTPTPTQNQFLIQERYGRTGINNAYIESEDRIVKSTSAKHILPVKNKSLFRKFLCEAFLPHNFPESVSGDYFSYQIFDTIQAFASCVTGTIATKAILQGVGVGNASATPIAAAITWIFKDGTGMFGSIIFAWWKGTNFDGECKKWRIFADVLNDVAMSLEICLPLMSAFPLPLLCLTSGLKAAVGVAGSATRAAITQHQAVHGNSADVSAKDRSQETAVNLLASLFGICVLTFVGDTWFEWLIFVIFILIHLLANFTAVSVLVFKSFNTERLLLVLRTFIQTESILTPEQTNEMESCIIGFDLNGRQLCGYDIQLGVSLDKHFKQAEIKVSDMMLTDHYLLIPSKKSKTIYITFVWGETAKHVIEAYFCAVVLAFALQMQDNPNYGLSAVSSTKFCLLSRLRHKITSSLKYKHESLTIKQIQDYTNVELKMFEGELDKSDWKLTEHSIKMDDWRIDLTTDSCESI